MKYEFIVKALDYFYVTGEGDSLEEAKADVQEKMNNALMKMGDSINFDNVQVSISKLSSNMEDTYAGASCPAQHANEALKWISKKWPWACEAYAELFDEHLDFDAWIGDLRFEYLTIGEIKQVLLKVHDTVSKEKKEDAA